MAVPSGTPRRGSPRCNRRSGCRRTFVDRECRSSRPRFLPLWLFPRRVAPNVSQDSGEVGEVRAAEQGVELLKLGADVLEHGDLGALPRSRLSEFVLQVPFGIREVPHFFTFPFGARARSRATARAARPSAPKSFTYL